LAGLGRPGNLSAQMRRQRRRWRWGSTTQRTTATATARLKVARIFQAVVGDRFPGRFLDVGQLLLDLTFRPCPMQLFLPFLFVQLFDGHFVLCARVMQLLRHDIVRDPNIAQLAVIFRLRDPVFRHLNADSYAENNARVRSFFVGDSPSSPRIRIGVCARVRGAAARRGATTDDGLRTTDPRRHREMNL